MNGSRRLDDGRGSGQEIAVQSNGCLLAHQSRSVAGGDTTHDGARVPRLRGRAEAFCGRGACAGETVRVRSWRVRSRDVRGLFGYVSVVDLAALAMAVSALQVLALVIWRLV